MGKVKFDISMSLDGFVAGPDDEIDPLHDWIYGLASWRERHGRPGGESNADAELLERGIASVGAIVIGRRMFDLTGGWGDEPPFRMPVFVVTHRPEERLVKGRTTFTFVTDGIESALEQARAAAGDKDVGVGGGASVIQQLLRAGLVDELTIHVVPVLLAKGIRLFDQLGDDQIALERTQAIESPTGVTHIGFRVLPRTEAR